jgi:hypothetical protein
VCVVGALRLISTASTANSSTWMVAPAAAAAAREQVFRVSCMLQYWREGDGLQQQGQR